jgi:hypothetical protein
MPGPPGYGLHQARDASPPAAKPGHPTEKDAPGAGSVLDERKDTGAQKSRSRRKSLTRSAFLSCGIIR